MTTPLDVMSSKKTGEGQWMARCPAHEDDAASLSIGFRRGIWLLHCHAGCSTDEILSRSGLTYSDLAGDTQPDFWSAATQPVVVAPAKPKTLGTRVAEYDYTDEHGSVVLRVTRFEPKTFRRAYPDGKGWAFKDPGGTPTVPYRLVEVLSAAKNGGDVWVVEGEKDVETIRRWGQIATCNDGGAGKWRPAHSAWLKGCSRVWVLPDGDEPGLAHGKSVAASVAAAGVPCVLLPALTGVKDVSEWAQQGATFDKLLAWAQKQTSAPVERKSRVCPVDVELAPMMELLEAQARGDAPQILETGLGPLDELIGGLQPELTIVGSQPGQGKSALMASIVRNLARRGHLSGVFSLEDRRQWIVRRIISEASRVPVGLLGRKALTPNQLSRVQASCASLAPLLAKIIVSDASRMTPADIREDAKRMVELGAKAIFVDHLGEVALARSDRHDRDIGEALGELLLITKELSVPLWVLCHTKRPSGAGDTPRASDFAFSADIERKARVALSTQVQNEHTLKIWVLKQTEGKANVGTELTFNAPSGMVC